MYGSCDVLTPGFPTLPPEVRFRFPSVAAAGLCLPGPVRGVHFNCGNRRPQNVRNGLKLTPRAGSGTRRADVASEGRRNRPPLVLAPPSLAVPTYGGRAVSP